MFFESIVIFFNFTVCGVFFLHSVLKYLGWIQQVQLVLGGMARMNWYFFKILMDQKRHFIFTSVCVQKQVKAV